jgi:hypothetical protein
MTSCQICKIKYREIYDACNADDELCKIDEILRDFKEEKEG